MMMNHQMNIVRQMPGHIMTPMMQIKRDITNAMPGNRTMSYMDKLNICRGFQ